MTQRKQSRLFLSILFSYCQFGFVTTQAPIAQSPGNVRNSQRPTSGVARAKTGNKTTCILADAAIQEDNLRLVLLVKIPSRLSSVYLLSRQAKRGYYPIETINQSMACGVK